MTVQTPLSLLSAATTTATSNTVDNSEYDGEKCFHAWGTTSSGTGAATIVIEVTNDTTAPWLTLGTISLTLGTSATADGFASSAPWYYTRARVSTISGTGAAVSVKMAS